MIFLNNKSNTENVSFFSNESADCRIVVEEKDDLTTYCSFWFEGILLTSVGIFGIIGNVFTMLILSCDEMRNSFNDLLTFLSLFDMMFITITIMDYSLIREFKWPFDEESSMFALLFPKCLYPINNIIFTTSIFLTIIIAYERYCAVCRPHVYRNRSSMMTRTDSSVSRITKYVILIVVFSTTYNIPKFLETELVEYEITEPEANNTVNVTYVTYSLTQLRNDPDYIFYYVNWSRLLVTLVFPVGALSYFNVKIFKGLK